MDPQWENHASSVLQRVVLVPESKALSGTLRICRPDAKRQYGKPWFPLVLDSNFARDA
jgi:hypothetical protein